MMSHKSVLQLMKDRRAIKVFNPHHRMTDEEQHNLFAHAFLAPSAFNIQHWRVVNVEDPSLRAMIREHAWDQPQVTDASLLLVICMDLKAWQKNPVRYCEGVSREALDLILPSLHTYYNGIEQVQRDECMRSCGLLAMSLMLIAQDMGYDSCPIDGFDFEEVGRVINLPHDYVVGMMLAIGKRMAEPDPRVGKLPLTEVLIKNSFPPDE